MDISTSNGNALVRTALVEDRLIETPQVGTDATKEGVETLFLNVVGEVMVDMILQGRMDTLLINSIELLPQSERFMDALMQRVVGYQSTIMVITAHVNCQVYMIEKEHHPAQRLQQ